MLDLRRARVLCEIADSGSFSAAADALGYTQSAVSHQVAAFERELGMTLVERAARPVKLTQAGQAIAAQARVALDALERAGRQIEELRGLGAGQLTLGAFPSAYAGLVPRALADLGTCHPNLSVTVVRSQLSAMLDPLRHGELDIALLYTMLGEHDPYPPPIELHKLLDDPIYVLLPAAHRAARYKTVRLASLRDEYWIAPSAQRVPDSRKTFERLIEQAGFTPKIAAESEDIGAAHRLVAAGVGSALVSSVETTNPQPGIAPVPLVDAHARRTIYAATIQGRNVPGVTALLDSLKRSAAQTA
jgi:DNA-binding transcriptional LysR family regulator